MAIRDVFEMCGYEALYEIEVLANREGAHLLVISDDDDLLPEITSDQRHDIALARLVDNDNIKACRARIELFDYASEWHDPNWYRTSALAHQSDGLDAQLRRAAARAAANSPHCVRPSDQRLSLSKTHTCSLSRPCPTVDEFSRSLTKLCPERVKLTFDITKRQARTAFKLVVELPPEPCLGWAMRWRG
jgi:hypothetical protein